MSRYPGSQTPKHTAPIVAHDLCDRALSGRRPSITGQARDRGRSSLCPDGRFSLPALTAAGKYGPDMLSNRHVSNRRRFLIMGELTAVQVERPHTPVEAGDHSDIVADAKQQRLPCSGQPARPPRVEMKNPNAGG